MSIALSKKRLFSQKDWDEADMLGKIEISIINPEYFVLTGTEEDYYRKIRKTFHVICEQSSELQSYRFLKELFPGMSHLSIYKLISDTQKFYSQIIEQNIMFDKHVQSNRILKHIELAKREGDFRAVASLEKIFMMIRGTDKNTEAAFSWSSLQLPEIKETSDVSVLYQDAEDISYEEE